MLTDLLEFYMLVVVWTPVYCQGCNAGWFGKDCTFMCHCKNSKTCDIEGRCPNNGSCLRGFFGLGCQYVDLLQMTSSQGPDHFLRDWDDTTCNPQPDADSIVVSLPIPITFTWFRMVLKDQESRMNFTVILNNLKDFTNEERFPVSDTVVDVNCDRITDTTALQIMGPAVGSICSIYISAGRNVALKQKAEQSSSSKSHSQISSEAGNAVDGNRSVVKGHCSRTDSAPKPSWWKLTFSVPQILYRIIIYNRNDYKDGLNQFTVETFGEGNSQTSVYNVTENTGLNKYEIPISTQLPVHVFKITSTYSAPLENNTVLTICEVEAFGDTACPENTYGLNCEKKCRCNAAAPCNPFTGTCGIGCEPGFYGYGCMSPCHENCLQGVCEFYSAKCLRCAPGYLGDTCEQECAPGKYGLDCAHSCSMDCTDVCNITNGYCSCHEPFAGLLCTECTPPLYGSGCDMNCSDMCADALCHRFTGECLACKGNRALPLCQDCHMTFFGPLCNLKCPHRCLNATCDHKSGNCLRCEEGYEGPGCHKISVREWEWLFMIPICIAFLLLIICNLYLHEPKEGSYEEKQTKS